MAFGFNPFNNGIDEELRLLDKSLDRLAAGQQNFAEWITDKWNWRKFCIRRIMNEMGNEVDAIWPTPVWPTWRYRKEL